MIGEENEKKRRKKEKKKKKHEKCEGETRERERDERRQWAAAERERERERAVVVAERRESKRHVFFCTILSTLSKRETTHNRRESVPRFFVFFCVSFCVGLHV